MNALETVKEYIPEPVHHSNSLSEQRVLVIGSGPTGMRFVQSLLSLAPCAQVLLFGNEPYQPYNRVQLTALLAGEVTREKIDIPLPNASQYPNFSFVISTIREINTSNKTIIDVHGKCYHYDQLVIATGARAHVPYIQGVKQKGVYTLRNLKDTESLYARIASSRAIVVVGGGLLGLEAARGLSRLNTSVTLIHQGPHLMNRQLDTKAADYLLKKVNKLGIKIITDSGVRAIKGAGQVEGVRIRSGEEIPCDTVLLCTGIQPNVELARNARIKISNGILVDDQLRTSAAGVYAIGECCEHRGVTYGLVSPGYEQAAIAVNVIVDSINARNKNNSTDKDEKAEDLSKEQRYVGSLTVSRLKVLGENVCSMGEVVNLPNRPFQSEAIYQRKSKGVYRKLVIYKGKIIGAVGVGVWPEVGQVQDAYQEERNIWLWQKIVFRLIGSLWITQAQSNVVAWPSNAIVCQCNGINQGQLMSLVNAGCNSIESLQNKTTAGTVCGSCKPLLSQMLGRTNTIEKEPGWLLIFGGSLVALMISLFLISIPEAKNSISVQAMHWFELIWNDKFWKQVTGFSLLGMLLVGLVMSLRKRLGIEKLGSFSMWRLAHIVLGAACATLLVFHTGYHFGSNLNQLLIINFIAVLLMGAVSGVILGIGHKLNSLQIYSLRKYSIWLHIFVTWPLPVLLGMHILSVYYF